MVRAAAACGDDFVRFHIGRLKEKFKNLPPCAGNAFEHGAAGFCAACVERQSEEDASGFRIPDRRAFSEQIGQIEQAAGA